HLHESIVRELLDRRARLRRELASVDAELAELELAPTTRPAKKAPSKPQVRDARKLTLPELTAELEAASEQTLNIRKANLDVKHTKALAKANPQTLELGGKGSWPTVKLLKAPPQGMFAFDERPAGAQDNLG
ncbi:MAG TPA: hypothetical protein VK961_11625, partial [Chthoniobacter sp.]|nr:hypothetical protein [Chthoniobacter sp.]